MEKKKKDFVTSDDEILPKLITIQNACHIRKTENIQKKKKVPFKYYYHSIITKIKEIMISKKISSFSFQPVSIEKVKDIIRTPNIRRACPDRDIPVKHIKINEDIFSRLMFQNFNQYLHNCEFRQF